MCPTTNQFTTCQHCPQPADHHGSTPTSTPSCCTIRSTACALRHCDYLQYGLPDDITELSSDEKETLAYAFDSNHEWAKTGQLLFQDPGSSVAGRIVIEVFHDTCPKTAENFLCLCTGERGVGKASKKPLHYKVQPWRLTHPPVACTGVCLLQPVPWQPLPPPRRPCQIQSFASSTANKTHRASRQTQTGML